MKGLYTVWERRRARTAAIYGCGAFLVLVLLGSTLWPAPVPLWLIVLVSAVAASGLWLLMLGPVRRRRAILAEPFPAKWEAILQREIPYYRVLEPDDRDRFRQHLQVFLGEKRITGIRTELDTTTRVLAAASAVIPILGFPEWEWDQIREVLVYPSRFGEDFSMGEGGAHHTLGMVGTGAMNRLMILSKPDLLSGFRNAGDKRNVGVHEFAHLVDKSDGAIDGLPEVGLPREAIRPWLDLVRRKMLEIREGESDIDPYAMTNEAEFFAVTSEYFFERPGVMQRKHPELYGMLASIFRQDLRSRAGALAREISRGRKSLGRNSPCPCGSGSKYKKCCLRHV